jgi:hypothetical protein
MGGWRDFVQKRTHAFMCAHIQENKIHASHDHLRTDTSTHAGPSNAQTLSHTQTQISTRIDMWDAYIAAHEQMHGTSRYSIRNSVSLDCVSLSCSVLSCMRVLACCRRFDHVSSDSCNRRAWSSRSSFICTFCVRVWSCSNVRVLTISVRVPACTCTFVCVHILRHARASFGEIHKMACEAQHAQAAVCCLLVKACVCALTGR